jgi:hypothetical protein
MLDQALAAGGDRRHHRQPRRHRLQCDVAERLGHRRIEQHVHRRHRPAEVRPRLEAGEDRVGKPPLEPVLRRPLADDQHLVAHLAALQAVDRLGEDVEPLLHHQPADEADHRLVVADAEPAPPGEVAAVGIEDLPVDAAGPDADIVAHPLLAKQLRHRVGRREDGVAAAVEAAQYRLHHRLEEGEAVIAEIGLEAGVDRGDHRDVHMAGQRDRAVAEHIGAGDVEDVRAEGADVAARPRRQHHRNLYSLRRGIDRLGMWTTSPLGGKAGSATVGE